jgi:hypothetical protein
MVIHNLSLPNFMDPVRAPVASRHFGPAMAALRRHAGYRFIVETDRNGQTNAWIERSAPRRR